MILWHVAYRADGKPPRGGKRFFDDKDMALSFLASHARSHAKKSDYEHCPDYYYRMLSIDTDKCSRYEQLFRVNKGVEFPYDKNGDERRRKQRLVAKRLRGSGRPDA